MPRHSLIEIDWPEFGGGDPPPPVAWSEYAARIEAALAAMEGQGLTHLVVYGDREHFANLTYLTGFDPRYEEALLILRRDATPLLVVGNECEGYVGISPLHGAGRLRVERYQSFSLLNQPRGASRLLAEILGDEGITEGARVGTAGWKYFDEREHPTGVRTIELPSYIVDTLRELAGPVNVVNATAIFMHPRDGLRTSASAAEIAFFEYSNVLASEGLKRVLFNLAEGMVDFDVVRAAPLQGLPFAGHITFATGANRDRGLAGPSGEVIRLGEPLGTNISYWGSNACRAGWIARDADALPAAARNYVDSFAGPYFAAMGAWLEMMQIGTAGGDIARMIAERLPFDQYGIFLNPGHLIHLDEWVSSPIYAGSTDPIRAGMVIQIDVIPSSPVYGSTRMEDGIAIADAALRKAIAAAYPDCYARCMARRDFMTDTLGFTLPDEVLPLSNIAGIVPPFFLSPNTVFALAG